MTSRLFNMFCKSEIPSSKYSHIYLQWDCDICVSFVSLESASNEDRLVVRFSDSSFEGRERTFSTITSNDLDTSHFEINDQSPNKMNDN